MSKPKTLRVVPLSNIMTSDSQRHDEGIAFDLDTGEAESLIALGTVVEVKKDEVEAGAPVEVLAAPVPEPEPPAAAPEPVQVQMPPAADDEAATPKGKAGKAKA